MKGSRGEGKGTCFLEGTKTIEGLMTSEEVRARKVGLVMLIMRDWK
jgi:hypothetical protein